MTLKKRQELPISLYVVATPIGNLDDLSVRAKEVLGRVDGVLCEDTRRTGILLSTLGLSKSLYRLDQHAKDAVLERAISEMKAGKSFALVTDAGTPSVSDPGVKLVGLAHAAGLQVSPIPGPSAVTAAVSVAGLDAGSFAFRGFFPRKKGDRKQEWDEVSRNLPGTLVLWFESPERIGEVFSFLSEVAPEHEAFVAKELTKIHEWVYQSSILNITSHIQKRSESGDDRGEWVFGVKIPHHQNDGASIDNEKSSGWMKSIECMLRAGVSASTAARETSQVFGVAKNLTYAYALEAAKAISKS